MHTFLAELLVCCHQIKFRCVNLRKQRIGTPYSYECIFVTYSATLCNIYDPVYLDIQIMIYSMIQRYGDIFFLSFLLWVYYQFYPIRVIVLSIILRILKIDSLTRSNHQMASIPVLLSWGIRVKVPNNNKTQWDRTIIMSYLSNNGDLHRFKRNVVF